MVGIGLWLALQQLNRGLGNGSRCLVWEHAETGVRLGVQRDESGRQPAPDQRLRGQMLCWFRQRKRRKEDKNLKVLI